MKKIILVFGVILFNISLLFPQQVIKTVSIDDCNLNAVATDGNNFYAAGAYAPKGSVKLSDGVIVKLDKDLNIVWQKTFGHNLVDELNDILVYNGKIYAVGISWRPKKEHRLSDAWLLILNEDGTLVSEKLFGAEFQDAAMSISLSGDGNLMITGYTFNNSNQNVWLLKVDPDGNLIWENSIGKVGSYESGLAVCPAQNGYLILAKSVLKGTDNSDPWIVKVDANANILWDRGFKLYEDNFFNSCIPEDDGWLLIGNTSEHIKSKRNDIYLMKLSTDGTKIEDKSIGTYMREWASTAIKSGNYIYIFGSFSKSDKAAIWVTDLSGNLLRQTTLNLKGITDAAHIENNKFVITGGQKRDGYVAVISY